MMVSMAISIVTGIFTLQKVLLGRFFRGIFRRYLPLALINLLVREAHSNRSCLCHRLESLENVFCCIISENEIITLRRILLSPLLL